MEIQECIDLVQRNVVHQLQHHQNRHADDDIALKVPLFLLPLAQPHHDRKCQHDHAAHHDRLPVAAFAVPTPGACVAPHEQYHQVVQLEHGFGGHHEQHKTREKPTPGLLARLIGAGTADDTHPGAQQVCDRKAILNPAGVLEQRHPFILRNF